MPKKKKTRLKQGLESDFSREARQETLVLWGEGRGIHSHGIHPDVRSPKALLKTFFLQSPPLFFFFLLSPSRLQNLGQHYGPLARLTPFSDLFALLWNQDSGQELCPWRITFRTWAGVTLPVNEGQSEVRPLCHQKVTLVQRNGNSKKKEKKATISISNQIATTWIGAQGLRYTTAHWWISALTRGRISHVTACILVGGCRIEEYLQ